MDEGLYDDARGVFDIQPLLNPVDMRVYAELGLPLTRYQYGHLMLESVGRRMTIRDLVLELIDEHIRSNRGGHNHEDA